MVKSEVGIRIIELRPLSTLWRSVLAVKTRCTIQPLIDLFGFIDKQILLLSCAGICHILFCLHLCRSKWIDSSIHKIKNWKNKNKKTGTQQQGNTHDHNPMSKHADPGRKLFDQQFEILLRQYLFVVTVWAGDSRLIWSINFCCYRDWLQLSQCSIRGTIIIINLQTELRFDLNAFLQQYLWKLLIKFQWYESFFTLLRWREYKIGQDSILAWKSLFFFNVYSS